MFAANAFALLGLRALYFLVAGLLDRLVYLSTGLALILAFIGAKLILHWAHRLWHAVPEISTALSLDVIARCWPSPPSRASSNPGTTRPPVPTPGPCPAPRTAPGRVRTLGTSGEAGHQRSGRRLQQAHH